MPTRTPRLCNTCRQPTQGRCPRCTRATRRQTDDRRGSAASRGYGHHWRQHVRIPFLRDNPLCCLCGALAEVPDHWPETRRSLVARGIPDPDDFRFLRSLCLECHARYGARD